jgi:hypothetical protein
MCDFDPAVKAKLDELRAAGFPVVSVSEAVSVLPPTLNVSGKCSDDLWVMKRVLPHGEALYMVLNVGGTAIDAEFSAVEKLPVAVADVRNRAFYAVGENGSWQCHFEPWKSHCFILGEVETSAALAVGECVVKTLDSWTIAPVERYTDVPSCEKVSAAPVKIKLGEWKDALGENFSGTAVYSTRFKTDADATILDLGEVKYACEVKLNGKNLGKRFFPPYVFDVRGKLKNGINTLEVAVTNTLANAITAESEENWRQNFAPVSPYHLLEKEFEKESLSSGLFGPVVLKK